MSDTPKLFVTGATGQLGGLVIDALLETVPARSIVAGVRQPGHAAAAALREKGVETRIADYARPETLASALAGIDRLLLISGNEIGQRPQQHRNVITAAKDAGVGLIAYTSILRADTSALFLAKEHRDTEAALAQSGVPFVLLRNGWYTEVYALRIPQALRSGTLVGAAGDGRISSAARADYARAAATVLAGEDHAGRIYELAGDESFSLAEFALALAEASGVPIVYKNVPQDDLRQAALAAGVPEIFAMAMADTDAGVAKGALLENGRHLSRLIGRPTTPFRDTVKEQVRSMSQSRL